MKKIRKFTYDGVAVLQQIFAGWGSDYPMDDNGNEVIIKDDARLLQLNINPITEEVTIYIEQEEEEGE